MNYRGPALRRRSKEEIAEIVAFGFDSPPLDIERTVQRGALVLAARRLRERLAQVEAELARRP